MARVLVVDDARSVRETLRIVLGTMHEVTTAPAVEDVGDGSFDVVILGLPAEAREVSRLAEALRRAAPQSPVLFLHAPGEVDREAFGYARAVDWLPKPFDAHGLRDRVGRLLGRGVASATSVEPATSAWFLTAPYLPAAAEAVVRDVVGTRWPVLVRGERGTGALDIARALHANGDCPGRFTALSARDLGPERLQKETRRAGTLFLDGLETASSEMQWALASALRDETPPTRIVAASERDLVACAGRGEFVLELAHLLAALTIVLPPLRDRAQDVPALARAMSTRFSRAYGLAPVTFTDAALDVLSHYLWFGNVIELEAVILRTVTLSRVQTVTPEDLRFDPEGRPRQPVRPAVRPSPVATAPAGAAPVAPRLSAGTVPNLEVLLGELAHELRNPMVTIKTFVQHLDSVLEDPETRTRFTVLATEAVGRMDSLLEHLLEYARFGPPVPRALELRTTFDRVLAEQSAELGRRGLKVHRNGSGPGRIEADEAQVEFALRSLLTGVVRDAQPADPLRVAIAADGRLELRLRTEPSVARRLARWAADSGTGDLAEQPPLALVLAATLVRRNGGTLDARTDDDGMTVITVEWAGH